jgi:hypothetical protein
MTVPSLKGTRLLRESTMERLITRKRILARKKTWNHSLSSRASKVPIQRERKRNGFQDSNQNGGAEVASLRTDKDDLDLDFRFQTLHPVNQ